MLSRQPWKQEEDKILYSYLISSNIDEPNFKWSQLSEILRNQYTQWKRNGKQCRQRWNNHLNPALLKENLTDSLDIQLYLKSIRENGRKWSVIVKFFPGRSENQLKNFFYSSLKKGLKNLNHYNSLIKKKKKTFSARFKYSMVDKALSINDEKKSKNLQIYGENAYNLSTKIIESLITFSSHTYLKISQSSQAYEILLKDVISFSCLCRIRRTKKIQQMRKQKEDRSFCTILDVKQKRRRAKNIESEEQGQEISQIQKSDEQNAQEQNSLFQKTISQNRMLLKEVEIAPNVEAQELQIFDVLNLQQKNKH